MVVLGPKIISICQKMDTLMICGGILEKISKKHVWDQVRPKMRFGQNSKYGFVTPPMPFFG